MTGLSIALELECFVRILMASLCGCMIGYERTRRLKEAGVRTHCVVACGAALMMVVSKYGFADIIQNGVYLYGSDGVDASASPLRWSRGGLSGGRGHLPHRHLRQGSDHRRWHLGTSAVAWPLGRGCISSAG